MPGEGSVRATPPPQLTLVSKMSCPDQTLSLFGSRPATWLPKKGFCWSYISGTLVWKWLLSESCVLPGLLSKRAWWQSPYELGTQDAHLRGIWAHSRFQLSVELCGLGLGSRLSGGCWPLDMLLGALPAPAPVLVSLEDQLW